jgi:hypothetical protein
VTVIGLGAFGQKLPNGFCWQESSMNPCSAGGGFEGTEAMFNIGKSLIFNGLRMHLKIWIKSTSGNVMVR